jgi:hypothetical protein
MNTMMPTTSSRVETRMSASRSAMIAVITSKPETNNAHGTTRDSRVFGPSSSYRSPPHPPG